MASVQNYTNAECILLTVNVILLEIRVNEAYFMQTQFALCQAAPASVYSHLR